MNSLSAAADRIPADLTTFRCSADKMNASRNSQQESVHETVTGLTGNDKEKKEQLLLVSATGAACEDSGDKSMSDQSTVVGAKCRTLPRGFCYNHAEGGSSNRVSNEKDALEVLKRSSFRKLSAHSLSQSMLEGNSGSREEQAQRRANLNQQLQSVLSSADERIARQRLQYSSNSSVKLTDDSSTSAGAKQPSLSSSPQQLSAGGQLSPVHYAALESNDPAGRSDSNQFVCYMAELPSVRCQVGVQGDETYMSAVCSSGYHPTMMLRARHWASTMKQLSHMREAASVTESSSVSPHERDPERSPLANCHGDDGFRYPLIVIPSTAWLVFNIYARNYYVINDNDPAVGKLLFILVL